MKIPVSEPRFKAGDVITYSNGKGEAIVDTVDQAGGCVLMAWRAVGQEDWVGLTGTRGSVFGDHLAPHPEADRVLAEFTAWRLTQ